jgi:hypothetical protein
MRFASVALLIPGMAFFLVAIAALQGDSDLPPYNPATMTDRVCSVAGAVIAWPAAAAAKLLGPDSHETVLLTLFWVSGIFWAIPIEVFFITKNALARNSSPGAAPVPGSPA